MADSAAFNLVSPSERSAAAPRLDELSARPRTAQTRTRAGQRRLRPSQVPTVPAPSRAPAVASPGQQVRRVLSSPGRPLRPDLQSSIGEQLTADLSAVRIHEGPEAAASARALNAAAYTSGNHIVAGDEHASIEAPSARRALRHELHHVKQQSEGPVPGTPAGDGLLISDASDSGERAARRAAEQRSPGSPEGPRPGTGHSPVRAGQGSSLITVQRDTTTRSGGVTYKTKTFDTNKERPSEVSGAVDVTPTAGRGATAVPIAGPLPRGYHGGHVLGLSLGGANISQNVVAMYPGFNTGAWKKTEDQVKDDAQTYDQFSVAITVGYPDDTTGIPDQLIATGSYEEKVTGKRKKLKKEVNYDPKEQPTDIKTTDRLSLANERKVTGAASASIKAGILATAAKNLASETSKADGDELKKNQSLPKSSKASYPDLPGNRPYEYLDILAFAHKLPINVTFADFKDFDEKQRRLILQANMARNGGVLKSDDPSDVHGTLSEKGTTDFPEIDHIIPKSSGGSNRFSNARVVSWDLNNTKARVKSVTSLIDVKRLAPAAFPTSGTWKEKIDEFLEQYLPRQDKGKKFTAKSIAQVIRENYPVNVTPTVVNTIQTALDALVTSGALVKGDDDGYTHK